MQPVRKESGNERVGITKIGHLINNALTFDGSGFFHVHAKVACQISPNMILVYDDTGTLFVELRESTCPENESQSGYWWVARRRDRSTHPAFRGIFHRV